MQCFLLRYLNRFKYQEVRIYCKSERLVAYCNGRIMNDIQQLKKALRAHCESVFMISFLQTAMGFYHAHI